MLGVQLRKQQVRKSSRKSLVRLPIYTLWYALLLVGALISIFPYWLALTISLRAPNQLYTDAPWTLPSTITLQNYLSVLTEYGFPGYILHTLIYAGALTIGQLVFSTFAAYAFARLEFPGRDMLFWLYLATLMIPGVVTLIPTFVLVRSFDWVDSYYGLIIPSLLGSPYGIFLMRQFFRTIPMDLENAARIEGASTWQILRLIVLPLCRPAIATLAIITFVQGWNDFLWPLIVSNSQDTRLLTVAITSFQSDHGSQWTLMMAATFITLAPLLVLFFLFQKHIVRSIHLSGFK